MAVGARGWMVLAAFLLAWGPRAADPPPEADLPVVVPSLPARPGVIRNPITYEQIHHIAGVTPDGKGLLLDLEDPSLEGTLYAGPYPFCEGVADYDQVVFRTTVAVEAGRAEIPAELFLQAGYNSNDWPEGGGGEPPTMTVGYRLDLRRTGASGPVPLGYYDGRSSFTWDGTAVRQNLTVVEGPLVHGITSDDPTTVVITWRTDAPASGEVLISKIRDGGGGRRSRRRPDR